MADRLTASASHNHEDALAFLRDREVFGDLVDSPDFTVTYTRTLASLHTDGAEATLDMLLGS
jgi:mannitol 2-dehydrogenase